MVLSEKMTVMQVRPHYSIVYQFKPQLKLEKEYVETKRDFTKFIRQLTTNWKDGEYFFKTTQGTFCYFFIEGRKVKLYKKSRLGKEYLCWQYFTTPVRKKKVVKKVEVVACKKR